MILSELISHGEVDDQMLLNATSLIRSEGWDFLESALVSWDNLPCCCPQGITAKYATQ